MFHQLRNKQNEKVLRNKKIRRIQEEEPRNINNSRFVKNQNDIYDNNNDFDLKPVVLVKKEVEVDGAGTTPPTPLKEETSIPIWGGHSTFKSSKTTNLKKLKDCLNDINSNLTEMSKNESNIPISNDIALKFKCQCGCIILQQNKVKHLKSKLHKKRLNELEQKL